MELEGYVSRKEAVLNPPSIFDILSDDFDYEEYLENYLELRKELANEGPDVLDKRLYEEKPDREPLSEEEQKLNAEFENRIMHLQLLFEEERESKYADNLNKAITNMMIEIARVYLEKVEKLPKSYKKR